jgi:hypothetical protein
MPFAHLRNQRLDYCHRRSLPCEAICADRLPIRFRAGVQFSCRQRPGMQGSGHPEKTWQNAVTSGGAAGTIAYVD